MNNHWQTIIEILEKQDYNFSVEDLLDCIWITPYLKSESRDARVRPDEVADTSQIHKKNGDGACKCVNVSLDETCKMQVQMS